MSDCLSCFIVFTVFIHFVTFVCERCFINQFELFTLLCSPFLRTRIHRKEHKLLLLLWPASGLCGDDYTCSWPYQLPRILCSPPTSVSHPFEERVKTDPSHSIRSGHEIVDDPIDEEAFVQSRHGSMCCSDTCDAAAFLAVSLLIEQCKGKPISFNLTANLKISAQSVTSADVFK